LRSTRVLSSLGLLTATALLDGCYPDEEFEAQGCESSRDCDRGFGCRTSKQQCVAIPANAAMGSFECEVTDASGMLDIGGSDVTGNLDDIEFSLITAVGCVTDASGGLLVTVVGLSSRLTLSLRSPKKGRQPLEVFNFANSSFGYFGESGAGFTVPVAGFVTGGFVELDRVPARDSTLRGSLEVFLELPGAEDRAGIGCEGGQAACGSMPFARTYCAAFSTNAVCTADCTDAGHCSAYGVDICDGGFCFASCTVDSDCQAPLACLASPTGARICG
jgi:hypothetical protein